MEVVGARVNNAREEILQKATSIYRSF